MRETIDSRLNKARVRKGLYKSVDKMGVIGAFHLMGPKGKLLVIVDDGKESGWEHVSVSPLRKKRTPTWGEMCWVKDVFWGAQEWVIQYHPPKSEYVNVHSFVLHLWRPISQGLPVPAQEMV